MALRTPDAPKRRRQVSIAEGTPEHIPASEIKQRLSAHHEDDHEGGERRRSRNSISMDRRAKRATAVTFFMRSLLGGMLTGDDLSKLNLGNIADPDGVRKPVVVQFLERAIAAVLRKSTKGQLTQKDLDMLAAKHQAKEDNDEKEETIEEEKSQGSSKSDSDSDSHDSEMYDASGSGSEMGGMYGVLQSLQDNLMQGTNVATLAGLLSTSTFSVRDRRIDRLIGPHVPLKVREVLMLELMRAIDTLWERFGALLVEEYRSFERAFRELDKDGSGFIDRDEFTRAYVDIHLRAMAREAGEEPPPASDDKDERRSSMRRMTLIMNQGMAAPSAPIATKKPTLASRRTSAFVGNDKRGTMPFIGGNVNSQQNIARMNRMILKADAEFLFDMLRTGERGLAKTVEDSDEELEVSMRALTMRLAGLGEKAMESLRERIIAKYSNLENAFYKFTQGVKAEMSSEEFEQMYRILSSNVDHRREDSYHRSRNSLERIPQGGQQNPLAASEPGTEPEKEVSEKAKRIFNGIDIDGSGLVTLQELQRALASFAPSTTFSMFRRRLLLQFGSFETFFTSTPLAREPSEDTLEIFTFELDLNVEDGRMFSARLGMFVLPEESDDPQIVKRPEVPVEGYSIEEFAISVFLNKAEEATIEDLIAKLGAIDRDKDIPFREFAENIVSCGTDAGRRPSWQGGGLPPGGARGINPKITAARALAAAPKSGLKKNNTLAARQSAPGPVALPVTCRLGELKHVYEDLQRENRRVSVNILLRSLTNVSDFIALDRKSYQSGDRIVCRIRLSADAQKRCKELPFVAVVPERLEWKDQGGRSHWSLDGDRVSDITNVCERVHELPRSSNGQALREACMRIPVPFVLASEERYEVRIFASSNGREPGRQIGRAVSFDLLMPRPAIPLVDQISLNAGTGEASVVLHWSPPPSNFASSPIMNFIVHVEPLIFRHEMVVEADESVRIQDAMEDDEDFGMDTGYKEVTVWSPALKGFMKKLSYRIDGLQRGVQYRFGVQCVHAATLAAGQGRTEIRGAPSELCDVVTMPLYNVTEAPGQPQPSRRPDGMIDLVWAAPSDEGLTDSNRICGYIVQYRHAVHEEDLAAITEVVAEESPENSSDSDDDEEKSDNENEEGEEEMDSDEEEGWVTIDESNVFIAQPRWADFVGWLVPCHIPELQPIDGEFDDRPHEFRVCAVNYAGNSPWSKPSACLSLNTAKEEQGQPPPVVGLEIVEVHGHRVPGEEGWLRSQCLLRWSLGASALMRSARYSVQVRDSTQVRGEGGWTAAPVYLLSQDRSGSGKHGSHSSNHGHQQGHGQESGRRRSSFGNGQLEAMVLGLERFPSFATLAIQVRAVTAAGTSLAEVEAQGVELPPPEPPQTPPMVIQALMPHVGPPVVELRFSPAAPADKGAGSSIHYVLERARAKKAPSSIPDKAARAAIKQDELEWEDFQVVEDVTIESKKTADGESVTCFARGVGPEGFYIFRVTAAGDNGVCGDFSPISEGIFELSDKVMSRSRRSMLTDVVADPDSLNDEGDLKPKKPRDLRVLRAEYSWCELSWDQRVADGGMLPIKYEVEVCREDTAGLVWQPVRMTYVCLEDAPSMDGGNSFTVKAASFFQDEIPKAAHSSASPRWRIRVRADGSDWSAPSMWQEPPQAPLPPQPSAPEVVRSEQQHLVLEWTIPEEEKMEGAIHYELQLQAHQQRRGGKFTDWTMVPVYTMPATVSEDGSVRVVRALVERRDVAEMAKISTGNDVARFRVRIASDDGMAGQPSGPSEALPIRTSLPSAPAPTALDLVGHGRILMESTTGEVLENEFVRLQWPLPSAEEEEEGQVSGDATLPSISYDLEAKDEDHGFWVSMPGALIQTDRKTGTAAALVPLPHVGGHNQTQTHFRVAACRRKGNSSNGSLITESMATYSLPSTLIHWGDPIELEEAPKILRATSNFIVVRFIVPHTSRPGICSVSGRLQVCNVRPKKRGPDNLPRQGTGEDADGAGDAESDDFQFGESDDEELDESSFVEVGEFPMFWQQVPDSDAGTGLVSAVSSKSNVDEGMSVLAMTQHCAGMMCEASLVLDKESQCMDGDILRIGLRVCAVGVEAGELSDMSEPVTVSDMSSSWHTALRLEFPSWGLGFLPVGEHASYDPVIYTQSQTGSDEEQAWHEEKTTDKGRFHFEVLQGSLPEGLKLDSQTGVIQGTTVEGEEKQTEAFVVQVRVLATWRSCGGTPVLAGTAASTSLKCSLVDQEASEGLQTVFNESVIEDLNQKGLSLSKVCQCLTNPRILATSVQLHMASEGDAGDSTLDLVDRLLKFPADAIVVAADLGEEELLSRLFGDDEMHDESSQVSGEEEWSPSQASSSDSDSHGSAVSRISRVSRVSRVHSIHSNDSVGSARSTKSISGLKQRRRSVSVIAHGEQHGRSGSIVGEMPTMRKVDQDDLFIAAPTPTSAGEDIDLDLNTSYENRSIQFGQDDALEIAAREKFAQKVKRRHSNVVVGPGARRVSLAAQATDIKLSKLSELAKTLGLDSKPRHLRDADSQPCSRRASQMSDERISEDSAEDHDISRAPFKPARSKSRPTSPTSRSRPASPTNGTAFKRAASRSRPSSPQARSRPASPQHHDDDPFEDHDHHHDHDQDHEHHGHHHHPHHKRSSVEKRRSEQHRSSSRHPTATLDGSKAHSRAESRAAHVDEAHGHRKSKYGYQMDIEISYPGLTPLWSAFTDIAFEPVIKCYAVHHKDRKSIHKRESHHAHPHTHASEGRIRGEELPPPDHGLLVFSIHPSLPAKVSIDPWTGLISGSPLIETLAGGQYTICARWEDTDDVAASCAVAFAVVSADVATMCNTAYLGQQPPAFRPRTAPEPDGGIAAVRDWHSGAPLDDRSRGSASWVDAFSPGIDGSRRTSRNNEIAGFPGTAAFSPASEDDHGARRSSADHVARRDQQSRLSHGFNAPSDARGDVAGDVSGSAPPTASTVEGMAARGGNEPTGARPSRQLASNVPNRTMPPLHLAVDLATEKSGRTMRRAPLHSPWRSKFTGPAESGSPGTLSRTNVFPLGPPLRNRNVLEGKEATFLNKAQPQSARLRELYETQAAEHLPWPLSARAAASATTAPNGHRPGTGGALTRPSRYALGMQRGQAGVRASTAPQRAECSEPLWGTMAAQNRMFTESSM